MKWSGMGNKQWLTINLSNVTSSDRLIELQSDVRLFGRSGAGYIDWSFSYMSKIEVAHMLFTRIQPIGHLLHVIITQV